MKEVIEFLKANRIGCLATVEDGKPRVRPWGFMLAEDGKFWFCTANTKNVFKQLKENPYMEFTSWEGFNTLRLSGAIQFSPDLEMKKKIMENNPGVKSIYQSPDNPIFEIFYLEHGQAKLMDKTYQF